MQTPNGNWESFGTWMVLNIEYPVIPWVQRYPRWSPMSVADVSNVALHFASRERTRAGFEKASCGRLSSSPGLAL